MDTPQRFTSDDYDADYYLNCMGEPDYVNNPQFKLFFNKVADALMKHPDHPKTVLDAGCACGHFVAALRDRGVEAYGVDISEYAISNVREDIRPFCRVCSLNEDLPPDFPKKYDMLFCIEILEHMTDPDGRDAIARITKLSDTILFSSTPFDEVEETHININPMWYWAEIFHEHGFYLDMLGSNRLFNIQSMLFRRNIGYAGMVRAALEDHSMLYKQIDKLTKAYLEKNEQVRQLLELVKNNHTVSVSGVGKPKSDK